MSPADYLRMSYYEKVPQAGSAIVSRLVTREEIETGKPGAGRERRPVPRSASRHVPLAQRGIAASQETSVRPMFKVGQRVRARNINPTGHTRLPRYARGKLGVIERDHGVYLFPDTNAHLLGEKPQHVYSVRFAARELWGKALRRVTPFTSTCGTTILSELNPMVSLVSLSELPRLPRDEGGPVFAEPWQAQAFALAVRLSAQGHFTWKEWAGALASKLQAAAEVVNPTTVLVTTNTGWPRWKASRREGPH